MRNVLAVLFSFLMLSAFAEDAPDIGLASVYSAKFQGKITASGEVFNHQALTASHRKLPFGTLVRITRVDNGKSVVVKINDRGPFINEYVTNLSQAAAQKLNMDYDSEAKVRIDVINEANDQPMTLMPDTRSSKSSATRRQNQAPQPSKSEPQLEVTPKSVAPKEYRIVPNSNNSRNSNNSYGSNVGQKKSLK